MNVVEKIKNTIGNAGSIGKLGWGLWLFAVPIGLISIGLFPFTGISIVCCLPAGLMMMLGGALVWVDRIGKK